MDSEERKKEEEKEKFKKKEFPDKKQGKECPKCYTINNLEARFCEECGYEFKEEKKDKNCPNCGTVNELSARFCEECGYEFEGSVKEHKCTSEKEHQITSVPEEEEVAEIVKKVEVQQNVSSQDEELLKMKAYTKKIKQKEKKEPAIKKKTFSPLFSEKQKASIKELDKGSNAEIKRQEEERRRREEEEKKRQKEEMRRREEEERKKQEEERKKRFKHFLKPIGNITFILTWEFSNSSRSGGPDIDMWIISPNSHELSSSRDGYGLGPDPDGGKIDHDDTGDGTGGPERAFWPEGRAPKGKYKYGVRYYSGNGNVNYQINVYINGKCVQTKNGSFSSTGNKVPLGNVYLD